MKKHILILLSATLIYFAIWMFLAFPYRAFPTDDIYQFLPVLTKTCLPPPPYPPITLTRCILDTHHPAILFSLLFLNLLWSLFSTDLLSCLLFSTVVSNSITLFLAGLIVYKITGDVWATLLCIILYGTSAWPAYYQFFYTHAPFAAMLSTAISFFIIHAYLNGPKVIHSLVISAVISGILCLSVSHAPVIIMAYFLVISWLFRDMDYLHALKIRALYMGALALTVAPFLFFSYRAMLIHFNQNMHDANYDIALAKLGFIPPPLHFTSFYVLRTFNPLLAYSFLVISMVWGACLILGKYGRLKVLSDPKPDNAIVSFHILIWSSVIVIAYLALSKVARIYFFLYPSLIIIISCMLHSLATRFPCRWRWCFFSLCLLWSLPIIAINIKLCSEIRRVRLYTPEFLKKISPPMQLYVLKEDIHGWFISKWLEDFNIKTIPLKDLEHTVSTPKNIGFLIGPSGKDSAKSVICFWWAPHDFIIDLDNYEFIKTAQKVVLPYYAYFPIVLMDQEVFQRLYFMGKVTDYKSDEKNITLLIFNAATPPIRP